MIYFSRAPVRPDSVEDAQYQALLQFKSQCERRGLIEVYDSVQEFREKLARQLAQTVIREFGVGTDDEASEFAAAQAARGRDPVVASLNTESRELLVQAAEDKNGTIMRVQTLGGLGIQTNGRQFAERGDPRSEATWDGALRRLRELDLLQDVGHKGQVFRLTDQGYEVADRIRGGVGAA